MEKQTKLSLHPTQSYIYNGFVIELFWFS